MDASARDLMPRARTVGLVVRELDGEVLIYDRKRDTAHCLTSTLAAVWRRCDGETSVADMVRLLPLEIGGPISEHGVWDALSKLSKLGLVMETVADPGLRGVISRRQLMKTGLTAAVAIPLITSIAAGTGIAEASTRCPNCVSNGGSYSGCGVQNCVCSNLGACTGVPPGCACVAGQPCCGNPNFPGCCVIAPGNATCNNTCGICSGNVCQGSGACSGQFQACTG